MLLDGRCSHFASIVRLTPCPPNTAGGSGVKDPGSFGWWKERCQPDITGFLQALAECRQHILVCGLRSRMEEPDHRHRRLLRLRRKRPRSRTATEA